MARKIYLAACRIIFRTKIAIFLRMSHKTVDNYFVWRKLKTNFTVFSPHSCNSRTKVFEFSKTP